MKPLPWSSSSLETFKNCPEQFRARYVDKEVRDVETEHKDWGNIVHKDFERYLDGAADLPPSLLDHKPYVDRIKEWDGILFTEMEAILSRQRSHCPVIATRTSGGVARSMCSRCAKTALTHWWWIGRRVSLTRNSANSPYMRFTSSSSSLTSI